MIGKHRIVLMLIQPFPRVRNDLAFLSDGLSGCLRFLSLRFERSLDCRAKDVVRFEQHLLRGLVIVERLRLLRRSRHRCFFDRCKAHEILGKGKRQAMKAQTFQVGGGILPVLFDRHLLVAGIFFLRSRFFQARDFREHLGSRREFRFQLFALLFALLDGLVESLALVVPEDCELLQAGFFQIELILAPICLNESTPTEAGVNLSSGQALQQLGALICFRLEETGELPWASNTLRRKRS